MPCYTEALDIVADSVWAAHIAEVLSVPMSLFHVQHCARCSQLYIVAADAQLSCHASLSAYSLHACGCAATVTPTAQAVSLKAKQVFSAVRPGRCRRGAAKLCGCLTMARTPTRPHGWLVWAPATLCATWLAASGPKVRLLAGHDVLPQACTLPVKKPIRWYQHCIEVWGPVKTMCTVPRRS